jgi:hypothetical protein
LIRSNNLPSFNACIKNWLDSQSDDDLRQALREDVGEMIRDRVREEIERRGVGAHIVPLLRGAFPPSPQNG